jgi:hypothetical protein
MNNQNLEGKLLPELREIAKELGIKKVESFKKIQQLLQLQQLYLHLLKKHQKVDLEKTQLL